MPESHTPSRTHALPDVRVVKVAHLPPGSTFGPWRATQSVLVWIIDGGCEAWVDDTHFDAIPGTIVLIPPEAMVRFNWHATRTTVHGHAHFAFDVPADWPVPDRWPVVMHASEETDLLWVLPQYALEAERMPEPTRSFLLPATIEVILRSLLAGKTHIANRPTGALPQAVRSAIEKMQQIVEDQQWSQETTFVDAMARHVHLTRGSLFRLFRKHLDATPMQCLRSLRLDRAASQLTLTDLSVKQIANGMGFESPFHFSRRFREQYDISPTEYRRRTRQGEHLPGNSLRVWLHRAVQRTPGPAE